MMKYKLSLAAAAQNDIEEIGRYIAFDNPSAAEKVYGRRMRIGY